jgi:hypothetical protein
MTQYEAYLPNYIDNKITALVGGAPSSLNTLGKLAQSIGNNANLNINIQEQLNGKQNVITDNSLSMSKVAGLDVALQNKYNKGEVDTLLASKQSVLTAGSVPITHVQNLQSELDKKSNNTDLQNLYTKTEVNGLLASKQNSLTNNSISIAHVADLQNELDKKASLISPVFLGNPTAPTAAISANNTQIATTEFVVDKVNELIDGVLEDMHTDLNTKVTTTQLNTALNTKYDKSEVNALLASKQDVINELPIAKVTNLQNQLDSKANLVSPVFVGVPTAPTPGISTNNTQIATTAFVKDVVSGIIDGAPEALNTLKEISTALQDDKNIFSTITNSLATKAPINNAVFQGTTTFTGPLNVPINGLNIANISGLQTEINDLKTNTSFINNLTDGAIPLGKVNGLPAALDTKLTASSNLDAGKIVNWANVINNAIDIAKINNLQTQLDAKTGNTDPILLSRVTGLENALNLKANNTDVYTKTQTDTSLGLKANTTDVSTALGLKANSADVYTRTQMDTSLGLKANSADVYTKTQMDTSLGGKQKVIADGDLTIAKTSGLQQALDGKLATTGSIPISQVTNLQTTLNNKAPFSALGDDPNYASTVNQNFALKANVADVYTKSQVDASLRLKANQADTDVIFGNLQATLNNKAYSTDVYTKFEVDAQTNIVNAALGTKANVADVYTKSQVDGSLALKAPIANPTFTGTITVDPVNVTTNNNTIATTAFVKSNIANLINGAPAALDTLNELATALGNDANFSTTVTNSLSNRYTKSETDTLLNNKQNTITDGSLTITKVNGLQSALDGKLSTSGSIPISQVTNLQTTLGNKAPFSALGDDPNYASTVNTNLALKANVADVYTKTQVNTSLAAKQDAITDGSLTIARTNGLQSVLDSKAPLASPTFTGTATTNNLTVNGNLTISPTATNNVYTKSQVDTLVASNSSSQTLTSYASEAEAYFNGVNQGSQYLKNGVVSAVKNKWNPIYRMTNNKTSIYAANPNINTLNAYLQYTGTQASAYSNLSSLTQWTVEAIIYPTSTGEQYIFDPRLASATSNQGLVFGVYGSPLKPSTWSTGDVTGTGGGGVQVASGSSTISLNTWSHIAWVKTSASATTISVYVNGVSSGTIPCGTNATTTSQWAAITIGTIITQPTTGYNFMGSIGGLRVSNTSLYTASFTAPEALTKQASTVLLLGGSFKEIIGNVTLTSSVTAGNIETYNSIVDARPYTILKRNRPANGEQSFVANVENPVIWTQVVDSRGSSLINLSSFISTTYPNSQSSGSVPNYNVFTFPVAGLYEFTLSLTVNTAPNYVNISLIKNFQYYLTNACGKPNYWSGEVFTCVAYMTPMDTAFFSVFPNAGTTTGTDLLTGITAHWCHVRLLD